MIFNFPKKKKVKGEFYQEKIVITKVSILLEGDSKHQNADNMSGWLSEENNIGLTLSDSKGVAAGYGGDCLLGPYLGYVSHIPPP